MPRSASCSRPIPTNAGKRRIQPGAVARPRVRRRRRARRRAANSPALPHARPASSTPATGATSKFVDAVAAVMDRRMEQDERIVVLGEDVHRLNGGTNGATEGPGRSTVPATACSARRSARTRSPASAAGMALDGRFRPVVEFMYPDFMWVAADQVFNQIGKARHMFGGDNPVPLVLRTKVAMGSGYGSQHLMDPAGIFATSPGWRIVAPSTAADYVGLMNAALALEDPVLVIEHVDLYGTADRDPRRRPRLRAAARQGRAAARRASDVDGHQLPLDGARTASRRSSRPASTPSSSTCAGSTAPRSTGTPSARAIKKTNAVLIVEQGARGTSYGGWLADEIQRRYFDWLDQPDRSGSPAARRRPSISKVLERAAIARTEEVVAGLERVRAGMGGALMATVVRMPEVLAGATEAAIQTWLVTVGAEGRGRRSARRDRDREGRRRVRGRGRGHRRPSCSPSPGASVAVGTPIAVVTAGESAREPPTVRVGAACRRRPGVRRPAPNRAGPGRAADSSGAASPPTAPRGGCAEPPPATVSRPERPLRQPARAAPRARTRHRPRRAIAGTGPDGRIVRRDLDGARAAPVRDIRGSAPRRRRSQRHPSLAGGHTDVPLTRHAPRDRPAAHREQDDGAALLRHGALPRRPAARAAPAGQRGRHRARSR